MAEEGHKVSLHVYDLSQGLARQLSMSFLGKAIEGIWHTGIVVYGTEYYFGGGIQQVAAGTAPYGTPLRVVDLGVTHVPKDVFDMYLQEISPRYTAQTYSLLSHNCNNFSNEVAQFLVGVTIPEYILNLPNEVLSSPMGALMMPMIQQLEATLRANAVPQVPQFQPSAASPTPPLTNTINRSSDSSQGQSSVGAKSEKPVSKSNESKMTDIKAVPPAVVPAGTQKSSVDGVAGDPLGNARNKVQEEIGREFAALMASGTVRASEAAALATRRVMQRYGRTSTAQS